MDGIKGKMQSYSERRSTPETKTSSGSLATTCVPLFGFIVALYISKEEPCHKTV
jgi:hypothetical protein